MEDPRTIQRNGRRWFYVAGLASVLLTFWLWYIDDYMTYSDVEQQRSRALRELRAAQFSLGTGVSDVRMMKSHIEPATMAEEQAAPELEHSDEHDHSHH